MERGRMWRQLSEGADYPDRVRTRSSVSCISSGPYTDDEEGTSSRGLSMMGLSRSVTAPPSLDRQARNKVNHLCIDWRVKAQTFLILSDEVDEACCAEESLASCSQVDTRAMVVAQIHQHPACSDLSDANLDWIVDSMRLFSFKTDQRIIMQGDPGQCFFVIVDGAIDVYVDSKNVDTLGRGESFGSETLLYGGSQPSTVVAAEDTLAWGVDGAVFRDVLMGLAENQHAENLRLLEGASIFDNLSDVQKAQLSKLALFTEAYRAGDRIVTEGEVAAAVYFVKEGSVSVVIGGDVDAAQNFFGGQFVRHLEAGDSFGKQAAMSGRPNRATMIADGDCKLVCMGIAQMKAVLGTDIAAGLEGSFFEQCLEKSHFIVQFSQRERRRIAAAATIQTLEPKAFIEGEFEVIVVIEGEVCKQADPELIYLQAGDLRQTSRLESAGETSCLVRKVSFRRSRSKSSCDVPDVAVDDLSGLMAGPNGARVGTLTQECLATALREAGILSSQSTEAIEDARRMLLARKVPLFHHLSKSQIDTIVQSFIFVRLDQDEIVFEPGTAARDFWVITKGAVEETNQDEHGRIVGTGRIIGQNGHFGVRALLLGKGRSSRVRVSSTKAEFWQLEQETFEQIVKGNVREELAKRFRLQDTPVELKTLRHISVIGKGGFGSVRMVQHSQDAQCRYALKRIRKEDGRRGQKILEMLKSECSLLNELDHPLIMLQVATFETDRSMYILSELISGGDLFHALDEIQRLLKPWEVQFYVGSLMLVLEFLSDRSIVYRDLKPENVLLDEQGYVKLIDFGTAKKLNGSAGRTFTVVGSYPFMAPEVSQSLFKASKSTGYGTEADIWSLGVMMFEFVCGFLPFGHLMDDPTGKKIIKAVHETNLEFPRWYTDRRGKYLIRGMMKKDPALRMGSGAKGFVQFREHDYFRMEDPDDNLFDCILGRQLKPPYVAESEEYQINDGGEEQLSDEEELCTTPIVQPRRSRSKYESHYFTKGEISRVKSEGEATNNGPRGALKDSRRASK